MISEAIGFYQEFLKFANANQVISGIVALWGLTVVTWLLRNVPGSIWRYIKRMSMRSITITSVGNEFSNDNFGLFLDWYATSGYGHWSRSLQLILAFAEGRKRSVITAGYGKHFFVYKGRLFWFTKSKLDSNGVEIIKEEIVITSLSLTQDILLEFVDKFKWKRSDEGAASSNDIYTFYTNGGHGYWTESAQLVYRDLKTVAMSNEIRVDLLDQIARYLAREEQSVRLGIAWKLSVQLTGPTGTGKTSLVRAIASYMKRDLYIVPLVELSDIQLRKAITTIPRGSIVLFEDYDSCDAVHDREAQAALSKEQKLERSLSISRANQTLAGILNAIDGVIPLHDLILFWTTNHPEKIDPAVTREGRIDVTYVLDDLRDDDIRRFILDNYPGANLPSNIFRKIRGAHLSNLVLNNPDNVDSLIKSIPQSINLSDHVHVGCDVGQTALAAPQLALKRTLS